MLAYYAKRSSNEEFEQLAKPLMSGMWVNGANLEMSELDKLVKTYDLTSNIVYDVRDRQELPRVEFSDEDAYVFLRVPHLGKSGHVGGFPMLCIVRPELFFSLSLGDTYSPENVIATTLPVTTTKTTDLLLGVIAACVASYQEMLKHSERSINDTGSRLRTREVTNQDFVHFVVVEDNLTTYRMNLDGLLAVVNRLKETSHQIIDNKSHEALDDIALHIQQLLVAVQSYRGRVESIKSAYSTIANNTLNQRMKTLTVFTVLITLPNVFYGMYGMNVALPFMNQGWAFPVITSFTIILTLSVYAVAKRLKIL